MIKSFWRTIILVIIIVLLSLLNLNKVVPKGITLFPHFDKMVHFLMYFVLSFVFYFENKYATKPIHKYWIVIDTVFIGVLLEFLQYLITSVRSGNVYDALFNTLGVFVSSIVFYYVRNNKFIAKLMFIDINKKI